MYCTYYIQYRIHRPKLRNKILINLLFHSCRIQIHTLLKKNKKNLLCETGGAASEVIISWTTAKKFIAGEAQNWDFAL